MKKSAYQMVNRGREDKPCWTVEHNGKYCYSNRVRIVAEGYLRLMRDYERKEKKAATV